MDVYRRYFKVTSGPLLERAIENRAINKAAQEEYSKILAEIGADTNKWYQYGNRMTGIIFSTSPDTGLYKKVQNGKAWWPKKTFKEGKNLAKRLESIETRLDNEPLSIIGLSASGPVLFGDGRWYGAQFIFLPWDTNPFCIISVPWYDENPEVIEEYAKKKANTACYGSSNMDHVTEWKPNPEMQEVKRWGMGEVYR